MGEVEVRNRALLNGFWTEVWDQCSLAPRLSKQGPIGATEAVTRFRSGNVSADFVKHFREAAVTGARRA
jgi:hypothetical protein